jgi:hypothetical protein
MKTNLLHRLKTNAPAGEKRFELKSELTILLLLFVALAGAGCETLDSGPPGAVVAPSSPWPAAATGHPAYAGEPGFAAGLGGRWYHDDRPTSIDVAPDGRNVTVIDEVGRRTVGYATSPREFVIPSDRLQGHLSHDGRRISWTNGGEWTRQPQMPGPNFAQSPWQGIGQSPRQDLGQGLSGRWFHDGRPTSITIHGANVTITNEHDQSSVGQVVGNNELVMSALGIRGNVSHDGRRISWSNGTVWTR